MRTAYYILVFQLLISCNTNPDNIQEQVYNDVIINVYEQITKDFDQIEHKNEILINPVDDHLDSIYISIVLNDTSADILQERRSMLENLQPILNNSPDNNFNKFSNNDFYFLSDKDQIESYNFDSSSYLGSSTISQVIFNETNTKGVFYLDAHFGEDIGSAGFIVEVIKNTDNWSINKILPLWTGK